MMPQAAEPCCPAPAAVAAQYEALRQAALGEALPLEARRGLLLFLRRGMWGWARTTTSSAETRAMCPPRLDPALPHPSSAVVQILAAMVLNHGSVP